MRKKNTSFNDSVWSGPTGSNYELEFLRLENQKLKNELDQYTKNKKIDMTMERDIAALLKVSMQMKSLLEACRSQAMLPFDLGKKIDQVIKEIDTYG
jgi:hypothetical protein